MMDVLNKKINTPELVLIKAAVKDMEPQSRRVMEIAVKLVEINRLLVHLNETAERMRLIHAESNEHSKRTALLELVMPYLSDENRTVLQTVLGFMELSKGL